MSCEQAYCLSCNAFLTRDAKHGLHGPHPRNCQYYLRDFDVPDLQKLLQVIINIDMDFFHGSNRLFCADAWCCFQTTSTYGRTIL